MSTDNYLKLIKAARAKTWEFPRADVVRIIDGDNVDLDVIQQLDLGFGSIITSTQRHSFRIFGINANELADPGGPEARDNLAALLPIGTSLRLSSVKDDKYGGRWDAILMANDTDGYEYNVAMRLIDTHWAVPWNGNGTKPKPPWPRPEDAHA